MLVSRGPLRGSHDTAKAEMICAGRDFAFAPRSNNVAGTILIGAKIRSTAMNLFRLCRLRRIVRVIGSLRVSRNGPEGSKLLVVVRPIPIAGPLPHIASPFVSRAEIWRRWKWLISVTTTHTIVPRVSGKEASSAQFTPGVPFQSRTSTNFHGFWFSSICNSPSLPMASCARGYRTPVLFFLS